MGSDTLQITTDKSVLATAQFALVQTAETNLWVVPFTGTPYILQSAQDGATVSFVGTTGNNVIYVVKNGVSAYVLQFNGSTSKILFVTTGEPNVVVNNGAVYVATLGRNGQYSYETLAAAETVTPLKGRQ